MPVDPPEQVTSLLMRWQDGDLRALDELVPLVYRELRAMARRYIQGEHPGHTLQSTALVHEVYVRLVKQDLPEWRSRAHFYAVAAQLMRQILVDHARARHAQKRGGELHKVSLTDVDQYHPPADVDVLALDEAITSLSALDPQQGRVVELKFFAGLSNEDAAEALGISTATVKRDWVTARAWLYRQLKLSAEP